MKTPVHQTNKNGTPNSSVTRKGGNSFFGVQAKLNIGKSNDKYEQEADAVADKVVAKSESPDAFFGGDTFFPAPANPVVQKSAFEEVQSKEETEEIQEKPISESITPVVQLANEEDDAIQKMPFEDVQQKTEEGTKGQASSTLENNLNGSKGGGAPLSSGTKEQMESGFGADFSNVRVHNDSTSVQMNKELGSQAFANGNDIYFNEGKYNPGSESGKHLLAHELTHTVQQGASSSVQTKVIQKQDGDGDQNGSKNKKENQNNANSNQQGNNTTTDNPNNSNTPNTDNNSSPQNNPQNTDTPKNNQQENTDANKTGSNANPNSTPNNEQNQGNQNPNNGADQNANAPANQGNTNANGGQQQGDNNDKSSADPVVFPTHEAFKSFVKTKKQRTKNFYTEKEKALEEVVKQQKKKATNQVNVEIKRLETTKIKVLRGINKAYNDTKNTIDNKRTTEITNAQQTATNELKRIDEITNKKQGLVKEKGENKAQTVISTGNEQSQRTITSSKQKVKEVDAIIRRKSNQYKNNDNAADVIDAARQSKPDTINKINEAGNTISGEVIKHAQKLAKNYRDDANNVATKFNESKQEARQKVIDNRDETIKALRDSGTEATKGLKTETDKLITEVTTGINKQITTLKTLPGKINEELYDIETRVKAKVRADEEMSTKDIEKFEKEIKKIYWHRDEVKKAQEDLDKAVEDQKTDVTTYITDVNTALTSVITTFTTELKAAQDKVIPTFTQIETDYTSTATKLKTDTVKVIDDTARQSETGAKTIGDVLDSSMQTKINEEETKWNSQLDVDVADMREKVSTGIREQAHMLERFESNLDTEFNRGSGFWEFLSGMVDGIKEGFSSLVSAIWDAMGTLLFWIIVLVIVLIIVFLVVVVGVALAAIGKVLLIIGAIAGVIAFLYFAARAIFTEGLTPYERGKLFGRGIFELALGLIGTGVYARLLGWIPKITRIVAIVSRISRMANYLRIVLRSKNLNALIRLIDIVQDVDSLLVLLSRVKHLDEIIAFLGKIDDFERVIKILSAVDDADALFIILKNTDEIGSILSLMERAITLGKVNSLVKILSETTELAKVLRILAQSGDEFASVLKILEEAPSLNAMVLALFKSIDDLPRFILLVNKEGMDVGILVRLVNEATDIATMFKVLEDATDLQKALALLNKVDELNDLVKVFKNADDINRIITLFDGVSEYNKLVSLLSDATEVAKLLDYLEGVADINKTIKALKNLGTELDDFLRLLDEIDMTITKLDKLLFMDNFSVAKFRTLLGDAGGKVDDLMAVLAEIKNLDKLRSYITHFGDFAKVKKVVDKATASGMTIIGEFLEACLTDGYKNWVHLEEFFNKIVAHGSTTPAAWREAIQHGRRFIADSIGNMTTYGGRTVAGPGTVGNKLFTLADNSTLTVTLETADIWHFISRHTWKYFKMNMSNVDNLNGMWPIGSDIADAQIEALKILNSADIQAFIRGMTSGQNKVLTSFMVGSVEYGARVKLQGVNGIISIYPISGPNIVSVTKNMMKAAVRLWLSI